MPSHPAFRASPALRAVTFDATGTLFECPRLGAIYSEVLTRHGAPVSSRRAAKLVRRVWQEFDCRAGFEDRFRGGSADSTRGAKAWWSQFVARLLEHLDSDIQPGFAAAELFDRFGRGESWRLFPEVGDVLAALRKRGYRLGVISNWDDRLPGLLEGFEALRQTGGESVFDAIVISAEIGVEKPHPALFEACLERLGVEAGECLHVGDDALRDVEGAEAVGMAALLLERGAEPGRGPSPAAADDLDVLLRRLPGAAT